MRFRRETSLHLQSICLAIAWLSSCLFLFSNAPLLTLEEEPGHQTFVYLNGWEQRNNAPHAHVASHFIRPKDYKCQELTDCVAIASLCAWLLLATSTCLLLLLFSFRFIPSYSSPSSRESSFRETPCSSPLLRDVNPSPFSSSPATPTVQSWRGNKTLLTLFWRRIRARIRPHMLLCRGSCRGGMGEGWQVPSLLRGLLLLLRLVGIVGGSLCVVSVVRMQHGRMCRGQPLAAMGYEFSLGFYYAVGSLLAMILASFL